MFDRISKEEEINQIKMNFATDIVSWIFLPVSVRIYSSDDGTTFTLEQELKIEEEMDHRRRTSYPVIFDFNKLKTKHLKIVAESIKKCPEWHRGYGGDSWIFVDEIIVK